MFVTSPTDNAANSTAEKVKDIASDAKDAVVDTMEVALAMAV